MESETAQEHMAAGVAQSARDTSSLQAQVNTLQRQVNKLIGCVRHLAHASPDTAGEIEKYLNAGDEPETTAGSTPG